MKSLKSSDQRRNYDFIREIAPSIKNHVVKPTEKIELKWTKKMVIEGLKKFVEVIGYSPSVYCIPDNLRWACERYFGSFNNAKKAAEIEIYPIGHDLDAETSQNSWESRLSKM